MSLHEEKINLLKKYYKKIEINNSFYIAGEIPFSKFNTAMENFGVELDISEVLGFYDITMSGTGRNGYIFSDTGIYYMELFEKPGHIYYNEINNIELLDTYGKNYSQNIKFTMKNSQVILWWSLFLNKSPLFHFLQEMLIIINRQPTEDKNIINIFGNKPVFSRMTGAMSGGNSASRYGTVNKLYDEVIMEYSTNYLYLVDQKIKEFEMYSVNINEILKRVSKLHDYLKIEDELKVKNSSEESINKLF